MQRSLLAPLMVVVLLTAGCSAPDGQDVNGVPGPGEPPSDENVTALATGLNTVWALDHAPDGRWFLTEREGRISTMPAQGGTPSPWAELDVRQVGESGLMGLVLHPDFPDEPWVYVCYTHTGGSGELVNRVARLREGDGGWTGDEEVLISGIGGSAFHDGCRLKIGPDRLLYVTMGDATHESRAQDRQSLNGKVLRVTLNGSVPAENPFDSPVFTLGHRNPQGLTFHPDTGRAFITEHGPSDFDEVNLLQAGENYGWPEVGGNATDGGRFHPSVWSSGPEATVAPAGAAFVEAPESPLDRALVFATLKARELHVLRFEDANATGIASHDVVLGGEYGRLRAVAWGPDDALYLATSNRDGRGDPDPSDDRVLRVPLGVLEALVG